MTEKAKNNFSELARALGRRGGLARKGRLDAGQRSDIARLAAEARWKRVRDGERLRRQLQDELIATARKKSPEERLKAYFNLTRSMALLSAGGKIKGELKNAG